MREPRAPRGRRSAIAGFAATLMAFIGIALPPANAVDVGPPPTSLSVIAERAVVHGTAVAPDGRRLVSGTLGSGDNVIDPSGAAIHLTGASPNWGFLASIDSTGTPEWVRQFPASASNADRVKVAVDASGNAVVMARFSAAGTVAPGFDVTPVGTHDALIVEFDPSGDVVWVRTIESANVANCCTLLYYDNISFDAGGVVVTGAFNGTVTVGASPSPLTRATIGGWDVAVVAFAADGTTRWLAGVGTTGDETLSNIVANPAGGTTVYADMKDGGGATGTKITSTATPTVTSVADRRLWAVDLPVTGIPGTTIALASHSVSAYVLPYSIHRLGDGSTVLAARSSGTVTAGATGTTISIPTGGALVHFSPTGQALWNVELPASNAAFTSVSPTGGDYVFAATLGSEPVTRAPLTSPYGYGDYSGTTLGPPSVEIPGGNQLILGRVSGTGQVLWSTTAPLASPTRPAFVEVGPTGTLTVTGATSLDTFTLGAPPDDLSISFTGGVTGSFLATMPATGQPQTLPGCGPLAFVDPIAGSLEVLDHDLVTMTPAATAVAAIAPAWSSDATTLAYVGGTTGAYEVRVVPSDGSASPTTIQTIASASPPVVSRLQFSPSGSRLSWEYPAGTINVAPSDGSSAPWTAAMLSDPPRETMGWSYDDRVSWVAADGLHVAAADGTSALTLAPAGAAVVNWSPDADTIYTFSGSTLWSVASDGSSAPASIPQISSYPIADALLAPGGTSLVVAHQSYAPGSWAVRVVPVTGETAGDFVPDNSFPALPNFETQIWRLPNGDVGYELVTGLITGTIFGGTLTRMVLLGALHGPALSRVEHVHEFSQTAVSGTPPGPVGAPEVLPSSFAPDGSHFFRGDVLYTSTLAFPVLDLTTGSTSPVFAPDSTDLAVTVSPPGGPIEAYSSGQVTVTVTNNGSCATAVPMVDLTLGAGGISIVGSTPSQGSMSGTHWMVGDLAPGASTQLTVEISVGDVPPGGLATTIDAEVRSLSGGDPDPSDNHDQAAIDLDAVAGIHGIVTDETTGLPIAGAKVGLYSSTSSGRLATATADAAGVYDFRPLTPGTYRLRFWDPAGTHVTEWHHDDGTYAGADDIAVVTEQVTVVDEALAGAGHILGRVRDRTTTQPLPGVTVTLYNATGGMVAAATTTAAGWYDFPALPAGTYKLKLAAPGYFSEWYQDQWLAALATPLTVTAGQTLTLDGYPAVAYLTSTATPELAGTLTETGTGTPLSGAVVRVYTATGQVASTATATDGTWTFGGLAKHTNYYLRFEHPGHTAEWWDDAPTFATATPYTYNGTNPNLNIDAALTP